MVIAASRIDWSLLEETFWRSDHLCFPEISSGPARSPALLVPSGASYVYPQMLAPSRDGRREREGERGRGGERGRRGGKRGRGGRERGREREGKRERERDGEREKGRKREGD